MCFPLRFLLPVLLASDPSALTIDIINFDETVAGTDEVWVLLFCNQARRVCKEFAPEWSRFSDSLKRVRSGNVDVGTASGRELGIRLGFSMAHLPAVAAFTQSADPEVYTIMGDGEDMTTKYLRRKLKKTLKSLEKASSGVYLKAGKASGNRATGAKKKKAKKANKDAEKEAKRAAKKARKAARKVAKLQVEAVEVDATGSTKVIGGHENFDPLWAHLKPGTAKGSELAKGFRSAGSAVWARTREALLKLESATLLHADPDVFIVDDLITGGEADGLKVYYKRRTEEQDRKPQWCFSDHYQMRTTYSHLSSEKNVDGNDCIRDQQEGRRIATSHPCNQFKSEHCLPSMRGLPFNRTVSRSVMTMTGENEYVDRLFERVNGPAGLHKGHAYHAQLLDYQPGEDYRQHTDCSGMENDRAVTLLVYLNSMAEGAGGHTRFPLLGGAGGLKVGSVSTHIL
jgi:hypothetical protein